MYNPSPELQRWLDAMSQVSGYLWEKGWAERNAGNMSIDVTDCCEAGGAAGGLRRFTHAYPTLAGRLFLVTGSGHCFRECADDLSHNACILQITKAGEGYRIVWGGQGEDDFRPTSEFPSHMRIHELLQEQKVAQKVVLHTHPTELIALSHLPEYHDEETLNRALWSIHPEVKVNLPRGVGLAAYTLPGSENLAEATVAAFRRNHAIAVWQYHGCVAIGHDVLEAFDLIHTLNKAAQVILLCRAAGHIPQGLTDEQIAEMVDAFKLQE